MNRIHHDIFRAIHEGKWLKIEYRNREDQVTKYWIGIRGLNAVRRTLSVDGLHLGRYTTDSYDTIYIDSILSSRVVEGTYCPINKELVRDIYLNPHKYQSLFDNAANLKILNYLEMCNRMDATPYCVDFELIHYLDRDSFTGESYQLNPEQFKAIVRNFQNKAEEGERAEGKLSIRQLAMNVLSIRTVRGLYVLACRKLELDVKNRILRPEEDVTVCTEFYMGETRENIRRYLDGEEYELLGDFEANEEKIKNCVTRHAGQVLGVDDMPYVIGLGTEIALDLHREYRAIIDRYNAGRATVPIKAFFGDLLNRPRRKKDCPITLIDRRINLDQLLAVNNAMKYPVAYIQGPPGTGKTSTIINTIITAFFNERTVLFVSYNNHPINGVFERLLSLRYRGRRIPFPALRLGNHEKMKEAIAHIRDIYSQVQDIKVFEATLDRKRDDRVARAKILSGLLKKYEDVLDLKERRETLNRMAEYQNRMKASLEMIPFQADLQGRQLRQVQRRIDAAGEVTDAEALALLDDDLEELFQYLFYTSARYIKRLDDAKYKDLRHILFEEKEETQVSSFTSITFAN